MKVSDKCKLWLELFAFSYKIKGETTSWLETETASALWSPRTLIVRQSPQHTSYDKELHKLRTDDDGMNSAFCVRKK